MLGNSTMIETDRLRLRPLQHSDHEAMVRTFMSFQDPCNVDECSGYVRWHIQNYIDHYSTHGYSMLAIVLKSNNSVIGDCGLEYYADIDGRPEVEIAYEIEKKHWNNGYVTEAASAVLEHAFTTLGLERIASFIDEGPSASRRVLEKIGLTLEKKIMKEDVPQLLYSLNKTTNA
ncbi:GNAT family N-acetyltransferase [bacterium AH-315-E10]|nr:GNAT family N-acetyltransferase [bacterium AH-315-E10]